MAGRREHEELTVITKTYDLILWSCNHTSKFPRNHRFVLGERPVHFRRTAAGYPHRQLDQPVLCQRLPRPARSLRQGAAGDEGLRPVRR